MLKLLMRFRVTSLMSLVIKLPKSRLSYVKLDPNYSARVRGKKSARIPAQKSDSPVQLENPSSTSSNSALEQLDIEQSVCVPSRKYTPEAITFDIMEEEFGQPLETVFSKISSGTVFTFQPLAYTVCIKVSTSKFNQKISNCFRLNKNSREQMLKRIEHKFKRQVKLFPQLY